MTYTPADLDLAPEAAARLEEYLSQVRAALAGAADVHPDEVEADIREHVGNELHAAPRPVPLPALDAVLARLGPPAQWGAAPDPTLFGRARHLIRASLRDARVIAAERAMRVRFALWHGPEDWRLPYLSFGVFALGALTVFVFPLALLVSYVLSRAGLAVAREKGITLGAGRKWLLYPPVVIVSLALLLAVTLWPVAAGIATAQEVAGADQRVWEYDQPDPPATTARAYREQFRQKKERLAAQVEDDRKLLATIPVGSRFAIAAAGLFVGFGAVALWWAVLGLVAAKFPRATRAVFCPLCDRFEPRNGLWLAAVCGAALVPWGFAAYEVVAALA